MKTFTFSFVLKCVFPLFFMCVLCQSTSSQTIVEMDPLRLARVIPERYFNSDNNSSNSETLVGRIDSVLWDGTTIGYIIHYKPEGIAVIPKIREINPLFILSARTSEKMDEDNRVELFFTKELKRRYYAIIHNKISQTAIQRNEKMWNQLLLADAIF
jgi:hypothetical protein